MNFEYKYYDRYLEKIITEIITENEIEKIYFDDDFISLIKID